MISVALLLYPGLGLALSECDNIDLEAVSDPVCFWCIINLFHSWYKREHHYVKLLYVVIV